jgi:tetratricopeptide (TPR) repeat protein
MQEYGSWIVSRSKVGYKLEVPKSDELVRKGWHFWNRRTREGFERGIECFKQAGVQCPSDFRTFEGLSVCYLMLATFGMRQPREMYKCFLDAHSHAVAVGLLTPKLRCNRALGLHVFERRLSEAEAEFLHTLQEEPTLASTYVRLALLYSTLGRTDEALDMLRRGYVAEPLLPMLPVTEVAVRFWRREFDTAIALGTKAVELHPYLQVGRAIYARALEFSGRLDEALAQYQIAFVVSPDLPWLRVLEGACFAKQRRTAAAHAILHEIEQLRRAAYVDAFFMVMLRDALGQRDEAFEELERGVAENSAWLYSIELDPAMDSLRDDPRFARLRSAIFPPD